MARAVYVAGQMHHEHEHAPNKSVLERLGLVWDPIQARYVDIDRKSDEEDIE